MKTVAQLTQYLQTHGLSPEELARDVNISNMTIRRLLKKSSSTPIPERHRLLLKLKLGLNPEIHKLGLQLHASDLGELKPFFHELEERGQKSGGARKIKTQIKSKLAKKTFSGSYCVALVQRLMTAALSRTLTWNFRFIAMGALLYFLDPFDFIPDAMVGIGYLDDFAVLSLVSDLLMESPVDWL